MSTFRTIIPEEIPTREFHQFLLGAVAPRPIAFVSTINDDGVANLAPYSFFNAFSSNPPILVFSSNRRVNGNTTKDTLFNVKQNSECVINVVNYDIVRQMTVASIEFPSDVSEFDQAGLTPIPSEIVRPFRVKESPVQMECQVQEIITLGEHGGAGHLVICKVLRYHIRESIIDENDRIDPHKIDLMGRMGRAYYVRASGDAVFPIVQSVLALGIGYPALPPSARESHILTANQIGMLASLQTLPTIEDAKARLNDRKDVQDAIASSNPVDSIHRLIADGIAVTDQEDVAALIVLAEHHSS